MKHLKHYLKVILFGVCLGLFLLVIQRGLQVDTDTFLHGYWIAAAVVLLFAVLFNILYTGRYLMKMHKAAALLESGETQAYMETVEKLRRKAKGKFLKNLFQLNLTAGYCDLKQFDKAIALLEPLSDERLRGDVRMVHRLNLCVCYFYTGQGEKALDLYAASGKIFAPFRDRPPYGGNLAILDMLAALEQGRYADAEAMLKTARKTWNRPRLEEDFRYIEEKLAEAKN